MSSNNYFGFPHGGAQYGQPGSNQTAETGYAVTPATYTTQRSAYETAYTPAATNSAPATAYNTSYGVSAGAGAAAGSYEYGYALPAAAIYQTPVAATYSTADNSQQGGDASDPASASSSTNPLEQAVKDYTAFLEGVSKGEDHNSEAAATEGGSPNAGRMPAGGERIKHPRGFPRIGSWCARNARGNEGDADDLDELDAFFDACSLDVVAMQGLSAAVGTTETKNFAWHINTTVAVLIRRNSAPKLKVSWSYAEMLAAVIELDLHQQPCFSREITDDNLADLSVNEYGGLRLSDSGENAEFFREGPEDLRSGWGSTDARKTNSSRFFTFAVCSVGIGDEESDFTYREYRELVSVITSASSRVGNNLLLLGNFGAGLAKEDSAENKAIGEFVDGEECSVNSILLNTFVDALGLRIDSTFAEAGLGTCTAGRLPS